MRIKIFLAMTFAAALLGSCKTAEFGFKVFDVNGMVYDFANRPVPHYELALGKTHKGITDINGRFTLQKAPVGNYILTGSKAGFESYHDEVAIKERGQIIYIRIPSQNQLLGMVDEALTANNFVLAEELAERALLIDENNIETLFYYAVVSFRQSNFETAISLLESAVDLGTKDIYTEKFLAVLREKQKEKQYEEDTF